MPPSLSQGATKRASSSARCLSPFFVYSSPLGGLSIHRQTTYLLHMRSCRVHAGEVSAGQVLGKAAHSLSCSDVLDLAFRVCREVRLCLRTSSVWQQPGRRPSLSCQIAQGTASHSACVQHTIFRVHYTRIRLHAAHLHLPNPGIRMLVCPKQALS